MQVQSFKKLWVSCHLLYPNPSQARDIFGLMIESGINQNRSADPILQGLAKLYRLYKVRDPVKSGSANFEFSATPLNYWKRVSQKCNKAETFILVVVMLELASFRDLSGIMRMSQSKVKYLLNQGIKKIIPFPVLRVEPKKEIKLKEYHTQDTSLFFISENIIEHVLGLSQPDVSTKIEAKLKENNRFRDYCHEILKFKNELNDLPISHHFDEIMKIFSDTTQVENIKKLELKQQKRIIAGLVFLVIIVSALIIRPSFITKTIPEVKTQKLVLEEIEISKSANIEDDSMSVAVVSAPTVTAVAVVPVSVPPKVKPVIVATEKARPASGAVVKVAAPTGVYRGVMTVTDFEQVAAIIRDRIIAVGGKKAGEVELGWIKNQTTSYFHFVFPAEKREELVAFIQQYGNLQYKFEPHPRVLPIGQARFIIEVHKGD